MKGSCLCRKITFEFAAFSSNIAHCHCLMCRKFHGAAYATYGTVNLESFRWLSGHEYIKIYQSSEKAERGFCSHCGSSLFYRERVANAPYEIALGVIDGEVGAPVTANIYYASNPQWSQGWQDLPKYSQGRTAAEAEMPVA